MDYLGVVVLVLSFLIFLSIGVPIAYSIGISGVLTMLVSIDPLPALTTFSHRMAGFDSFALLAIPFFILAGNIMNSGGIALRLINLARVLVGKWPAGLAFVNIFANMLFGAISGSAAASASAIGSIMGPEMKKEGYSEEFSAAVNISSATTGLSIPPSNVLIVYSLASGGASITALFLAGYIPGILTGFAIMLMSMCMVVYKNKGFSGVLVSLAKVGLISLLLACYIYSLIQLKHTIYLHYFIWGAVLALLGYLLVRIIKSPRGAFNALIILWKAIPSLFLLVIVIGGIVKGFFTATEASVIGVAYAFLLALAYGELGLKDMPAIILKSVKTTSIVLLLVATCIGLSWIMAYENIPQTVSASLMGLSDNIFVILLMINLLLLLVGVFMDITPAVLIFTPIFLPIVESMGVDPIHFGIIMVLNLSVGLCTPPVGSVLFIGCTVAKVRIERVVKPLLPMFLIMILCLLLVTYLPQLSLWLPSLFEL